METSNILFRKGKREGMTNSFYSAEELKKIGFKKIGTENVLVSRKASIYGAENISLGSHVRIDDFCILSGNITIGNHSHIAAYSALFAGKAGIVISDFACCSVRCTIFAINDDYSGAHLIGPVIPDEYRGVSGGQVILEECALLGSGCTVLPSVVIGEGTAVGSMSLVKESLEPWGIYAGIPCKRIKERSNVCLELKEKLLEIEKESTYIHGE